MVFLLPDLHKVIAARGLGTFQLKRGEVQHDLPVNLHNNLKDTISVCGVVLRVVG